MSQHYADVVFQERDICLYEGHVYGSVVNAFILHFGATMLYFLENAELMHVCNV